MEQLRAYAQCLNQPTVRGTAVGESLISQGVARVTPPADMYYSTPSSGNRAAGYWPASASLCGYRKSIDVRYGAKPFKVIRLLFQFCTYRWPVHSTRMTDPLESIWMTKCPEKACTLLNTLCGQVRMGTLRMMSTKT